MSQFNFKIKPGFSSLISNSLLLPAISTNPQRDLNIALLGAIEHVVDSTWGDITTLVHLTGIPCPWTDPHDIQTKYPSLVLHSIFNDIESGSLKLEVICSKIVGVLHRILSLELVPTECQGGINPIELTLRFKFSKSLAPDESDFTKSVLNRNQFKWSDYYVNTAK